MALYSNFRWNFNKKFKFAPRCRSNQDCRSIYANMVFHIKMSTRLTLHKYQDDSHLPMKKNNRKQKNVFWSRFPHWSRGQTYTGLGKYLLDSINFVTSLMTEWLWGLSQQLNCSHCGKLINNVRKFVQKIHADIFGSLDFKNVPFWHRPGHPLLTPPLFCYGIVVSNSQQSKRK